MSTDTDTARVIALVTAARERLARQDSRSNYWVEANADHVALWRTPRAGRIIGGCYSPPADHLILAVDVFDGGRRVALPENVGEDDHADAGAIHPAERVTRWIDEALAGGPLAALMVEDVAA